MLNSWMDQREPYDGPPEPVMPQPRRPTPEEQYARIAAILQNQPATAELARHESSMPTPDQFKQGTLGKILMLLAAGGTGALEGPARGIAVGQEIRDRPYKQAMSSYAMRGQGLQRRAEMEGADTRTLAGAYEGVSDRAMRQDVEDRRTAEATRGYNLERQGLNLKMGEQASKEGELPFARSMKQREVAAEESRARSSSRQADAAMKSAERERQGLAEQRVPVDQQDKAEQRVIDRMSRTDARVQKYFKQDEKTGFWTPVMDVKRPFWFSRQFNAAEQEEYKKLQAEIDKAAEEMTTGVRFNPKPGFGSPR